MDKGAKKVLKYGGIALIGVGIGSLTGYATTKFLMSTALDRNAPKAAKKAGAQIAGSTVDSKFLERIQDSSLELAALPLETVETESADGTKLVGHWYYNPNAKRIIVAMHGWRSTWTRDFGMIYDFWHKNDCSVLYAEQRGQSKSGGDYMAFGLSERFDCQAWVNWISKTYGDNLPIYLAGVSMGATTVLLASELNLPQCVHGIVADCGFTSPDEIWHHVANNNLHIPYALRRLVVDYLYQQKTSFDPCYSTCDALINNKIPVLFIHGSDDHFVPVSMTYDNYKACAAPKKILIVPGADHGMSYYKDRETYEDTVRQFWNDYD